MATAAPQQWYERPLTHRDLDDLPEDNRVRYEVIDGELHIASFPSMRHQQAGTALVCLVYGYVEQQATGEVFTFELRAKRYKKVAVLKDDETFMPALFPGLVIPLAELWG